jgi:diaminohydroxyphosphoribosylaminopyrimidine deaminase / 5-amino-6-(5-phosphoribosylamino)uracil reductase
LVVADPEVDQRYMRVALLEAKRGVGRTSPNPAVGAILVADGKIISRGYHRRAGGPHAEVECLKRAAGRLSRKATLYITLEPCSTVGETGRCTDLILAAGLHRVVVGTLDVNPRHQGRGVRVLEDAGIDVTVGVLNDECAALNEAFNKWITTGRPFVIAKCGMTLDGRLTRPHNEPRWITSPATRRHAHALRAKVDAILIGAEPVRTDDPQLTVRGVRGARQPWRVVVTRSGKLPSRSKLLRDRFADHTLIYRKQSLDAVLSDLGKQNVTSVLIEGGGKVLGEALDAGLIDKLQIYIAPLLSGGPVVAFAGRGVPDTQHAAQVNNVSYKRLSREICVTGYPRYQSSRE